MAKECKIDVGVQIHRPFTRVFKEYVDVVNDINDACKTCATGCYATPLPYVVVDYMPSGYTYDVSGSTRDPFEFITTGVLEDSFHLEPDVTDIYIYMAKRSQDRMNPIDSELEESEIDCLMRAMKDCGIEPVSTVEYTSPIIVTS